MSECPYGTDILYCSIFIKITFSINQKELFIFLPSIKTLFCIHQANNMNHNWKKSVYFISGTLCLDPEVQLTGDHYGKMKGGDQVSKPKVQSLIYFKPPGF